MRSVGKLLRVFATTLEYAPSVYLNHHYIVTLDTSTSCMFIIIVVAIFICFYVFLFMFGVRLSYHNKRLLTYLLTYVS